jgi:hypothetical protein
MKKINFGKAITLIANIGVIGGILLLAYELRQNNDLMEAEARQNRMEVVVDSWMFTAEHGDFADIKERSQNGEELSGVERRRIDSAVMANFVMLEWTFRELSENSAEMNQVRDVQIYNFANKPEFPRVWTARKNAFHPAFVQWMEQNVVSR